MEFFIIWLLCGIVAAVVASNKGRNVFGWLVLGFLLGPIGMILSLVVSKNQVTVEQQAIESGGMRKCPFCAELIRAEAVKCRFCGSEVTKQEAAAAPARLEWTHCPACGKAIRPGPGDTKCMWCEADLTASRGTVQQEAPPKTPPSGKAGDTLVVVAWIVGGLGVAMLGTIAVFIVSQVVK